MDNVGDWLRSLGLGRYEPKFRDAEIGEDVLPELTEADLIELGLPLGDRKRLLKAIALLGLLEKSSLPPRAELSRKRDYAAERRQLTVMFCDLVGSTELSTRLDPEDMRDVIRAYQDACSSAVSRHRGFVAKFMGDGVLAYFGYPRAHEDDAERAVRAGLEIASAVAELSARAGEPLQARVGIATGLVVVGDLIGEGPAQEQAVVGDTPNLAARLQTLAEPGGVLIAKSTRRLIGGTFELSALGPQTIKGFKDEVPAWAVLREARNVSRFEAARHGGLTPFVAREQEIGLLVQGWADAAAGSGRAILLSGEAGIGKSRLTAMLRERIRGELHVELRYQCSPNHANDPFYPIAEQIWHAAGFTSDEPPANRLDKLEALIARSGCDARHVAPYLAALLTVPAAGRYPALELSPGEQKELTIGALIDLFVGLAQDAPVLALLEDVHWIDPSSLDFFNRLVDRLASLPALLIVTFRPEFVAPWLGYDHVAAMGLNRLEQRQAADMIERVSGGRQLPAEVLNEIIAKTDGVPLFVEELTKTVLESGLLREEQGAYVLAGALTPLAIPSTLQDSLMARLDRLAPVREVAQIGAAIGREFSYSLLEAVSPIKGAGLRGALQQLAAAELIYPRGSPSDATYVFKHALVQDTAYSSLLRSRRQRIHADIAQALDSRFSNLVESAPAVIAYHYAEAGLSEAAARYWLAAAELAHSRAAPIEANYYADAGLKQLPHVTDELERRKLELGLQVARANALLPMKGYNGAETLAALTEAKQLLDAGIGDDLQRFTVLHALCAAAYIGARIYTALPLARELVEVADRQGDPVHKLVSYRILGAILQIAGDAPAAVANLERAESFRDPERDKRLSHLFGLDAGLDALNWKTLPLLTLGRFDDYDRVAEQVLEETAKHSHPPTIATCNSFAVVLRALLHADYEAAERHGAQMVAYCAENKIEGFRVIASLQHAAARMLLQPTWEEINACRAAIETLGASGMRLTFPFYLSLVGEASLALGDIQGAKVSLQRALERVRESGERQSEVYLWALDLHIAAKGSNANIAWAEEVCRQRIEAMGNKGRHGDELLLACELARIWRDAGRNAELRALLEPALAAVQAKEPNYFVRTARALLAGAA
jgi:class 3 adenylate cyclase